MAESSPPSRKQEPPAGAHGSSDTRGGSDGGPSEPPTPQDEGASSPTRQENHSARTWQRAMQHHARPPKQALHAPNRSASGTAADASHEQTPPNDSTRRTVGDDLLDRVAEACATEARPLPDDFNPQDEGALAHSHLYFNRELSILDFNRRVLAQALDDRIPLLERIFFLSITASNLDEFFRKRAGGLKRQAAAGVKDLSLDGRRPEEQLQLIRRAVVEMYTAMGRLWDERLAPQLARDADVEVLDYDALGSRQQEKLDDYFQENIFPILTPLAVGPGHPFPFLSNLSLSLAVMLRHPQRGTEHFARVKVPVTQGRWVSLADASAGPSASFVPLEQLVAQNLGEVFRGMEVENVHAFRVTRNADIRRDEEEADDLLEMISDELRERRFAPVVRLEIDTAMPPDVRRLLMRELKIDEQDLYETDGLLGHADLMPLARLDRPEHRFASWSPVVPPRLRADEEASPFKSHVPHRAAPTDAFAKTKGIYSADSPAVDVVIGDDFAHEDEEARPGEADDGREALPQATRAEHAAFSEDAADSDRPSLFRTLRAGGDLLVHHPYESFRASVQRFIEEAADDPKVLAIKQTLYRTSEDSPVVQALMRAAERGKQVAVLVEVKARFDEKNNIEWGRMLEKSGVHVTYGLVGLKTHAKVTLVVRQEDGGPRTYCHIGTGNYNSETARHYTDLGLLTSEPDVGYDLINLFHYLTGYAPEQHYRTMLVAPTNMRDAFVRLVRREVRRQETHGDGRIIAKMNALNDTGMIRELYRASRAGVQIDLVVRGHSLLRPGLAGISENIRVISILGRFLEHTRIYYFGNGSGKDPERDPKVYIGSADWMSRNLNERVEAIQQVQNEEIRARLVDLLHTALDDQRSAWVLHADGRYLQRQPTGRDADEALGFQDQLLQRARQPHAA